MNKITLITSVTRWIGKSIANWLLLENHTIINISKSGIIPVEFDRKNFLSYKCDISNIKERHTLVKKYYEGV